MMVPQAHLPPGWEVKNIGDILSLEYGKPLPKEKEHQLVYIQFMVQME